MRVTDIEHSYALYQVSSYVFEKTCAYIWNMVASGSQQKKPNGQGKYICKGSNIGFYIFAHNNGFKLINIHIMWMWWTV